MKIDVSAPGILFHRTWHTPKFRDIYDTFLLLGKYSLEYLRIMDLSIVTEKIINTQLRNRILFQEKLQRLFGDNQMLWNQIREKTILITNREGIR